MPRKYIDCSDYPGGIHCSLRIMGEEDEVVRAATEHAVSAHGAKDSAEFREQVRAMLKEALADQPAYVRRVS